MITAKEIRAAYFFDLDDTIYDQLLPFKDAVRTTLNIEHDFPYESFFIKVREASDLLWTRYKEGEITLTELRLQRLVHSFNLFGETITVHDAEKIQAEYEKRQHNIYCFEGFIPFITELIKKDCVVGLITNGPVKHQMKKVYALKLLHYISKENIFISDAVGFAKPDKRIFHHVTKKIGFAPKHCYYIGDSWTNDVVASSEAGWNSIWFNYRHKHRKTDHTPYETIKSYHTALNFL